MTENQTLLTLLETDNQAIFSTVTSLFDNEKIHYVTRGAHVWKSRLLKLEVDRADEERARKLLKDVTVEVNTHSDPLINAAQIKWFKWGIVLGVIGFYCIRFGR
jgi:hypothetical protein